MMNIINWDQFIKTGLALTAQMKHCANRKSSMTVGVFDGVHLGHQALLRQVVLHNAGYVPVVVTFRQNPKANNGQKDILNFKQRLEMLENIGIQIAVVIDFTEDFKRMPGAEFLEILLRLGNPGFFTVGSNFRCGYKLDTNAEKIKSFFASCNIPAEIIPEVMEGSSPISSSRIRTAIAAGDMQLAEKMLNRQYN